MVALPTPTPFARPPLVIVTTPVSDDAQVTEPLTSSIVPLPRVAIAWNCVVSPFAMLRFEVVTRMDCTSELPPAQQLRIKDPHTQRSSIPRLIADSKLNILSWKLRRGVRR